MTDEELRTQKNNLDGQISSLQADLSACTSPIGDWKVIKIYEARLANEADPYDYAELSAARNAARAQINALQAQLAELTDE